jgi:tetratricopeptide (TPR) repeat protein
MLKTLLAVLMAAPAPPLPPTANQNIPAETQKREPTVSAEEDLAEAQALYVEGKTKYDSADYAGAIDKFTKALGIVSALSEDNEGIKLTLLYNIASAHEKAFAIDKDLSHLRQALQLYKRYKAFAEAQGDIGDQLDVETKLIRLEKKLRVADQLEANRNQKSATRKLPPPPEQTPVGDWKKPRNVGIGLTVAGGVALVGGVVMVASGSRLRSNALEQVNQLNDLMVPPDHPAWVEGDEFIESETRRGRTFMAVGGTLAGVGAIGTGVGVYFLVKSGRLKNGKVQPSVAFTSDYAGVQLKGRF